MQRWVGVAAVLLAFASIACASSWEPSYYDRLVGFSVAKRNSTTDTLELLLPNSSFPFLAVEKERRVGLSGWSNWAQHLYAAQRHAAGIGVAPDKMALPFHVADLFEDGKESAKVRFHRHVVEDSTAWTVEDDEYAEPVEVSKGDFMSVWKQMEDPSHDSDAYLQVRILSWNLFLVSKLLNRQQDKRAPLFGKYVEKLGDFDAMCVSECFSPNACNVALDSLRAKGYKSITTPINKKELGGLIQNAGVYVATKHTIVAQHNLIYSDHWTMRRRKSMLNYVVKRGAVLARIRNKQGYIFSVVCTHPDYSKHNEDLDEEEIIKTSMVGNDLDSIAQEQRQRQLRELRQFVDAEVKIPETEPLIFAGDFNVDKALYANVVDSTRLFGDGADRNGETGYRFAITPSTLASIRRGVLQGRLKHYRKLLLAVYSQMYGTPHLRATMRVLEVTSAAAFGGEPFTLDPETNELVHTKKAKYLDYIFVDGLRRVAPLPFVQWTSAVKLEESDTYEVGVLGKLKNWWKGNKDHTMRDLSDHYPVMALLRFPKSKMDPPLSPRIDLDPHEADDPSMRAIGLGDWRLINRVLTRIGYAADALVMWPRAATRLQRMIANRAFEDRLVLHEDYTPCGVWRHYFRQETGHFKWIPRDPLSIFAELTRPATLPPYVEMDLRLMTYNLFMPSGIQQLTSPFVAKRERAEKLPKYIDRLGGGEPLDAICFTECFDDSLCGQGVIGKGLAELGYTSISKPVTEDKALGLVQDTGVFVASPHELVQERALAFKNTAKVGSGCWATPANCVTQRGVVWVTLRHKVSKKLFHVACASFESANVEYDYKRSRRTHDAEASARRVAQVKEMQQLLRAADVENEPLAVMFDANVNLDMVRAPSGTSTWHAWKAPMSTDPALRAGDQDAHEFLDQMFDSSVWARHEWVVWAGEQYASNPAESKLAQRFSFMQPHASSAIVWATPSVGGSTIDFSANARRVMWVPRVRLDKKDMYHAPGFTKKLARLWRKLRGEAPSSDERWDDLSTDYPVMSRFVWVDRKMVYLHSKAQENGSFKLKLSDEEAAQFDPAVVAAGRLKFDWLAVPGTRAKVDGRATLKPEDVPTAEQWSKYRRLWHVKKHERLVQASEGSELSERSEQSEEDRALQQADEMLSLGQRRRL